MSNRISIIIVYMQYRIYINIEYLQYGIYINMESLLGFQENSPCQIPGEASW